MTLRACPVLLSRAGQTAAALALMLSGSVAAAEPLEGDRALEPSIGVGTLPSLGSPGGPMGIINGVEATESDYPMTGGMLMDATLKIPGYGNFPYNALICSSTLIAPDVVMLAAHCMDEDAFTQGQGTMDIKAIGWTRQADLTDYDGTGRATDWPEDTVAAWDWVKNEDFDIFRMQMGTAKNYDIALLFLEEPVLDVTPAYVITAEERDQLLEGNEVEIVGWGQQTATSGSTAPPAGTYAIKMMGSSIIGELDEYEFQVGPEEEDVRKCHGDSGGPTFMNVESDSEDPRRLIGVTSHSYDMSDCKNKGGVDTRVDGYLEWIEAEMTSRCEDGTRAWCDVPGLIQAPLPIEEEDPTEEGGADGKGGGGKAGCGCASSEAPLGLWGALAAVGGLLTLRRRR